MLIIAISFCKIIHNNEINKFFLENRLFSFIYVFFNNKISIKRQSINFRTPNPSQNESVLF